MVKRSGVKPEIRKAEIRRKIKKTWDKKAGLACCTLAHKDSVHPSGLNEFRPGGHEGSTGVG
jgi:hypothetical protein